VEPTDRRIELHVRSLASRTGDSVRERAIGLLGRTLEYIVVAVRMFEAVFIESEVSELARYLLYVGLPVQLSAVIVTLLYTAPGGTPLLPSPLVTVLVTAVLVAGFTPFLILGSYIVRLTVVARRTADTFPFSSQSP